VRMKRYAMVLALSATAIFATAQKQTEYNRLGDEAMARLDYSVAKMLYEEGVVNCNTYSINQLASIWLADESMRVSMRIVMSRSLKCLTELATQDNDTASIKKLILFYTEGIGTEKSDQKAAFWENQYKLLTEQHVVDIDRYDKPVKKTKMDFFVGYSGSLYAPFGLTFGGVGKTVGFYLRARSNLSFQNYTEKCDIQANQVVGMNNFAYQWTGEKKSNILMATVGPVFRLSPVFYLSLGGGYWSQSVIYEFNKTDLKTADPLGVFWARSNDKSMEGVAIDLDGMFRIANSFYVSVGGSALSFKYLSANAGIGLFF